jgi:hypothetical protein
MINQPWKNKNWYSVFITQSYKDMKKVGYRYLTNNKKTFNLSDVKQWNMHPPQEIINQTDNSWTRSGITHLPAVCEVYLSDKLVVRLVQGKVPTSQRITGGTNDTLIDPIVEVDQITPFFDAMKKANIYP